MGKWFIADMWNYAEAAYEKYGNQTGVKLWKIERDSDVLLCSIEPKRLVFAFRGSDDKDDWRSNFDTSTADVGDKTLHDGFESSAVKFVGEIAAGCRAYPGRAPIITGHSRGASEAIIAKDRLFVEYGITASAVAFAPARVTNGDGRDRINAQPGLVTNVVNGFDLVYFGAPPLPWYRHVGKTIYLRTKAWYGLNAWRAVVPMMKVHDHRPWAYRTAIDAAEKRVEKERGKEQKAAMFPKLSLRTE